MTLNSIIPTLKSDRDSLTAKIALALRIEALGLPARIGPFGPYSLYKGDSYGSVDLIMQGPNWTVDPSEGPEVPHPGISDPPIGQPLSDEVWRARMRDVHQVRQAFGCHKFNRTVDPKSGQVRWAGDGVFGELPHFHINVYTPGLMGLLPTCQVTVEEVTETKTTQRVKVVCGGPK